MERKKIHNRVLHTGENRGLTPGSALNIPVKALLASFRFLFEEISTDGTHGGFSLRCQGDFEGKFLASLRLFLLKLDEEQEKERNVFMYPISREADSIDACNHLFLLFSFFLFFTRAIYVIFSFY